MQQLLNCQRTCDDQYNRGQEEIESIATKLGREVANKLTMMDEDVKKLKDQVSTKLHQFEDKLGNNIESLHVSQVQ